MVHIAVIGTRSSESAKKVSSAKVLTSSHIRAVISALSGQFVMTEYKTPQINGVKRRECELG